jgi:5-(aminomethyl)-3-furanmethanol phosphate kinase
MLRRNDGRDMLHGGGRGDIKATLRSRAKPALAIVKLGGSHALQPHLRSWLTALAECGRRVIVAPGGGPFADEVRRAQKKMAFNNRTAHHMALLSMEQFGLAICSLEPRLVPAASLRALRAELRAGRTPVWMAAKLALAASELEQSWDLTSDSLAAWLAGRIGAKLVALVKHGAPFVDASDLESLVARGIVDPLFPRYLKAGHAEAVFLGPTDHELLGQTINSASPCAAPGRMR